jgi:hypothetical protein
VAVSAVTSEDLKTYIAFKMNENVSLGEIKELLPLLTLPES